MDTFDPSAYWEERLRANAGLLGVGYTILGRGFNQWLYKVRSVVFSRTIRELRLMPEASRILDVGSGTGFYIERWERSGASSITGSDLTEVAVTTLGRNFPRANFRRLDIGDSALPFPPGTFDIVSAFDVLFHIVDDGRYARAIDNVYSLLSPGGWFLFSDMFTHFKPVRGRHLVWRTLRAAEEAVRRAGFEVVGRRPMFILMNEPFDSSSRATWLFWRFLEQTLTRYPGSGHLLGATLFPAEIVLTRLWRESPTTEIMICRKPSVEGLMR